MIKIIKIAILGVSARTPVGGHLKKNIIYEKTKKPFE